MATYLLLRNNKQQGPLSLQHLIQLGLKPYDLVWVEGKSAAWRYPSEIPELKPYSVAVEEQPFDRFYKKQEEKPEEKKEAPVIQFPEEIKQEIIAREEPVRRGRETVQEPLRWQPVAEQKIPDIVFPDDEQYKQYQPQVEKKEEKSYPRKTVYVTMPVQPMHEPGQELKEEIKQEPVYKRQEPVFNLQSSPAPITDPYEEPVSLNTKYSQPLDEIKEMYVKKLHERKKQSAQKKFFIAGLKKAAVIIGIISIGVLIGFAIKPKSKTDKLVANTSTIEEKTDAVQDEPVTDQTNENIQKGVATRTATDKTFGQAKSKKKVIQQPTVEEDYEPVETKPVILENKKAVLPKQKPAGEKNEPDISEPSPGVDINASTGERSKKTRTNTDSGNSQQDDEEESNSNSKADIRDMVSIKSNDYYVVAFGGIRNLQLTVLNDSKYVLDKVTVKVDYVRPNGATLKSDNISFKAVSPNGSSTIRMPDTNRGVKVYYKIVKVESKEFKNDMAGL